ncbi:hypothetical protein N9973_00600 [bacterium]|nr:hypothetical protein [bacterium]
MKTFIVDIDGTICTDSRGRYELARPIRNRIKYFNNLVDSGHTVIYWTARGGNSGKDWSELTKNQLKSWNVKYTELRMGKPAYDFWIDDKAYNGNRFFDELHQ